MKPLLYVYRVLLTGIHLMRTGVVNANLVELNAEARLPYIADLIARKQSGENTALEDADVAFHQREYERLRVELQAAHDASQLPELPSDETRAALNDLLVRVRLKGRKQSLTRIPRLCGSKPASTRPITALASGSQNSRVHRCCR